MDPSKIEQILGVSSSSINATASQKENAGSEGKYLSTNLTQLIFPRIEHGIDIH